MTQFDRRVSRRTTIAAATLAPVALAAPAVAQQTPQRVRFVTTWPDGLPGLADSAQRLATRITALSQGSLEVEYYPAGTLVGPFDSFDAVRNGDAEMYSAAEYYWQSRSRLFNFFTTVPFGFTSEEFNSWLRFGGGQALWDQLSGDYGLKPFAAGNTGVQMGGWYANPIESLADMKGLKIRIPGLAADIFRALGSEPVSLPGGAIPAALFAGEIDAVEWVGPYNDLEFGVQKVLRNYMYPGFHEPGTSVVLGVNLGFWNGLGAREKLIIETVAAEENRKMLAEYSARSSQALTQLQAEYGTNVRKFSDDIYAEVARISEGLMEDLGSSGGFAGEVVQSFLTFRGTIARYSNRMSGQYARLRETAQSGSVTDVFGGAVIRD